MEKIKVIQLKRVLVRGQNPFNKTGKSQERKLSIKILQDNSFNLDEYE